jgi:hypothetical protein
LSLFALLFSLLRRLFFLQWEVFSAAYFGHLQLLAVALVPDLNLSAHIPNANASFLNIFSSMKRFSAVSFLLSFNSLYQPLRFSAATGSRITAAATTGPAKQPRPASSHPITAW